MTNPVTDDTKVIECNTDEEILGALEILGGAALMHGNRRLYEHMYGAKVRYDKGLWFRGEGPVT